MTENGRAWCFQIQYPNKKPALVGTVFVRLGATNQEIEEECWKKWEEIMPDHFELPKLISLVPGIIVFLPKE